MCYVSLIVKPHILEYGAQPISKNVLRIVNYLLLSGQRNGDPPVFPIGVTPRPKQGMVS